MAAVLNRVVIVSRDRVGVRSTTSILEVEITMTNATMASVELGWVRDDRHRNKGGSASDFAVVARQAPPLVRQVGIEAVAPGHLGHRRARRRAGVDDLALQLCTVTPATGRLGVRYGAHRICLVGTVLSAGLP